MSLIKRFILGKQKKEELLNDLFNEIKEKVFEKDFKNFLFEEKNESNKTLKTIKFKDRLFYEEIINNDKSKTIKLYDIEKNKEIYVKKINKDGEVIAEKKRIKGYLRNIKNNNDYNIKLLLSNDIHIYVNARVNKLNLWSRVKEERNLFMYNQENKVENFKVESVKRVDLIKGILKLFKDQNGLINNLDNSIEYTDENIGKVTIKELGKEKIYSFYDKKGEKLIEELYQEEQKKSLKYFQENLIIKQVNGKNEYLKENVCRYEEKFIENNIKLIFHYNKKEKCVITDRHNTLLYTNDNRNKKYLSEGKKNRKLIKEQRESDYFKIVFEVYGKTMQIHPNKCLHYKNTEDKFQMIAIRDQITENQLEKLQKIINENKEELEQENKNKEGIIKRVIRKIKPA